MPRFPRPYVLLPLALLLAVAWGCGSEDSPTEPEPGPDLDVASLTLTPSSAAFAALGDTVRFNATAHNAAGDEVPADIAWSSTAPAIVSVDTAGLAESEGGGEAEIIATADGFADTAAVTVTLTTLVWREAVSGDWDDPQRWRGGVAPTATDTARIDIAGAYTVSLGQDTEVARLELGGGGGTQTLATGSHAFEVGSLLLTGGAELAIDGAAAVTGVLAWRSGSVTGAGTLAAGSGGEVELGGGSAPILELWTTLENQGTVALVSGVVLYVRGDGRLSNPAGSLIDFRSDGSILPFGGGTASSAGTIRKSGGATVSAIGSAQGALSITGPVEVRSGALRIAGGDVRGEVSVDEGLRLEVLGGTVLAGEVAFTGAGSLDVDGSVTIGEEPGQTITIPRLALNNGTIGGQATIAVTDSLIWTRGGIVGAGEVLVPEEAGARLVGDDFAKRLSGRSLRLHGLLTTGSDLRLQLDEESAVIVESTGRWEQGYRGRIEPVMGGAGSLRIDGVFTKADVETTLVTVPTVCTGSLLLDRGILVFSDSFELTETGLLRGGGRIAQPGQNIRLAVSEEHGGVLAGTIEPDSGGQPAWLGIAGPVSLVSTTTVLIDLAAQDPIRGERLVFSDAAVFAGVVEVTVDLVPESGENFRVVTRSSHASRFDQILGAEGFDVFEDDTSVRLIWPEER